VVGPEQDDIVAGAVDGLEGIARDLTQVEGVEGQGAEASQVGGRGVVRVSEDADVWVEGLQSMFGVLIISIGLGDKASSVR